jgi:hypothetical protein
LNKRRKLKMKKIFFVVALSFLLMLSAGMALGQAYGTKVVAGNVDDGRFLNPLPMAGFASFDVDASASYNQPDPVYLNAIPIAVRLTPFMGALPGRQVVFGNPDFGMPSTLFAGAAIVYLPVYGNTATYDPRDPIYLVADVTVPTIQTNDVRLTPVAGAGPAGSKVFDFNIDHGVAWAPAPATWTIQYVDTDQSFTYSITDRIYLHMTPATFVTPGDLRLTTVP